MKEEKKPDDKHQKKLIMENQNVNQQLEEGDEIDRLVSLSFDENPVVRQDAAKKLGKFLSDPRAVIALIDLSADKNEGVKQTAKKMLENYNYLDKDAFSSLEKFFEKLHENKLVPEELEKEKNLMLPQVEKLFSSQVSKEKLLPSIKKLFSRSPRKLSDFEQMPEKKQEKEAFSSIDQEEQIKEVETVTQKQEHESKTEQELDFPLPTSVKEKISSPIFSIPKIDQGEEPEGEKEEKLPISFLDFYKFAYSLAITPEIKSSDILKEKKNLISTIKHNIDLAFKLAIKKAKQEGGIESLKGLKVGMKKISTLPLDVLDVSIISVVKAKKSKLLTRILLSDGKNNMPLYLSEEKASGIKKGDLITLKNVYIDFLIKNPHASTSSEKGELCFLLSKNSQIIITRYA